MLDPPLHLCHIVQSFVLQNTIIQHCRGAPNPGVATDVSLTILICIHLEVTTLTCRPPIRIFRVIRICSSPDLCSVRYVYM